MVAGDQASCSADHRRMEDVMLNMPWDQPATMIDLDGKAPIIGTIRDYAQHFAIFKPHAKEQARILLTQPVHRSEEHTSELQSLMRISYAVFCLKQKKNTVTKTRLISSC